MGYVIQKINFSKIDARWRTYWRLAHGNEWGKHKLKKTTKRLTKTNIMMHEYIINLLTWLGGALPLTQAWDLVWCHRKKFASNFKLQIVNILTCTIISLPIFIISFNMFPYFSSHFRVLAFEKFGYSGGFTRWPSNNNSKSFTLLTSFAFLRIS